MANANSKASKQKETKDKEIPIFEKEIARLPPEMKKKLISIKDQVTDLQKAISESSKEFSMGFYITPKIEIKNNAPMPNFDDVTFSFLLDDFEKPIPNFNPRLLLGDKFDKLLKEEIKKDQYGQDYAEYTLKSNPNIKFEGISISILRENCFDAIYDDLKQMGSSFILEDNRGFIAALKSIDLHRNMLLQKFEKYVVVYAGAGSWLRGEKSNDFDIFVVVDDTDVKRMPRAQVKEQLTRIVWQMAAEVAQITGIQVHAQVYLLTDFWDALKDAHPVMFTFLRDGVPFYDRGIYSAWKELLKLGKIRPSAEAIDMHMNVGTQLIDRAKKTFVEIFMSDIYHSVLNPSQALLMLKGYNPTTPKETIKMFKEVLLAKEKSITKKEVEVLENTIQLFKKLEHDRDATKVAGKDLDKYLKDAEDFLKKIKEMFEEITADKTKESILSTYSEVLNQMSDLMQVRNVEADELFKTFEKDYVKTGIVPSFVGKSLKELTKAKKDYDKGTLTVTEVNKVLKEARNILAEIKEIQSKKMLSNYARNRTIISYDKDKVAELINYDGKTCLLDVANNKGYEITKDKFKEFKLKEENFADNTKYKAIMLNETLLKVVKEILKTEEIFL